MNQIHITSTGVLLGITQLFGYMLSECKECWEICEPKYQETSNHFQKEEMSLEINQLSQLWLYCCKCFLSCGLSFHLFYGLLKSEVLI